MGKPWRSKGHGLKSPGLWQMTSHNVSSPNTQNQGSANYSPQAKCNPLPALIKKTKQKTPFIGTQQWHLFQYCL